MPLRRLRKLARKAKSLRTEPVAAPADRFGRAQDGAMAALNQSAEGIFAVLGAAVVSSWEVALADLARALRGRLSEEKHAELIERMSDSLVPTEQPFSGVGKRYSHAVKTGTKAALDSGNFGDVTSLLGEALGGLGAAASAGWPKTAEHMAPILESLVLSDAEHQAFVAQGNLLQVALDSAWQAYMAHLDSVVMGPDLEKTLVDGLEAWKDEAVRAVELNLYQSRAMLIEAAERLPLL